MTLDAARLDDLPVAVLEVDLSTLARAQSTISALASVALTAANEQARQLLGADNGAWPTHLADVLAVDQHALVESRLRELMDTGRPVEAVLAWRAPGDRGRASSDPLSVLMRASPARAPKPTADRAPAAAEGARAFIALVVLPNQQTEFQQFVNTVSHDLQEPLRMVVSFAELLQQRHGSGFDERGAKYLHYMVDGARRMQGMLGEMLTLARVVTQGKALVPTDSARALADVLARMQPKIAGAAAQVSAAALPRVLADEDQLQRVFAALIDNSLAFRGPEPPRIHVAAVTRGGECTLSVTDNGVGMEARHLEAVFTVFRRLRPRDEHSGHGTGLTIARAIVRRHGGRIWIESEPGRGTTVYFTLARAR